MIAIHSDRPWWINAEPNYSRLQISVVRKEVILGRDTILNLEDISSGEAVRA